jgi:hypothetical protein
MASNVFYDEINITKLKVFTFLRWYLYGRNPKDVKFQNLEYFFWFPNLNIGTKSAIKFVLWWNLLNKTEYKKRLKIEW